MEERNKMRVIDNFVGRRNKEDNAYLHEVTELITEFIVNKSVEIAHHIDYKDADAIAEEVKNWLLEDCHSAED